MTLRIKVTSLFVDDQDQALSFYTETLGFVKKRHVLFFTNPRVSV